MIIPALDVLNNNIVRLYQGKYESAQFYPLNWQHACLNIRMPGRRNCIWWT